MKRVIVLLSGALLTLAGATIGGGAQAAAIAPSALRIAADQASAVDKIQFVFRGRRYCWYYTGWRGPGWYWCGYRWRRGFGWGGPVGWHGWRRPGAHRPGVNRPGGKRPGVNRPGGNRPGANRPGNNRPGANRPGNKRPGANRPGGNRPGGNRPGGNRGGNRGNRGGD